MDSPVRLQLKRNDYLRHKLFRKINRRRRAKRQLEIEAPVKELKKRLRLKRTFEDGKDGDRISKNSDFSDEQLSRLVVDNSYPDLRYIYDPSDPMRIGSYMNVLEKNGWSINDPKAMLTLRELYDIDQTATPFDHFAFDAGPLPEVTVKPDYNKWYNLILRTYYPFHKGRYGLTGHSELSTPGGNRISTNGNDADYNFILNNCSDATRKALELAYHKAINPFLFTTPGDVKDFAELKLGGKTKTAPSGGVSITEIPVKLALLLQIANYAKQIEDTGKYAGGKDEEELVKLPEVRVDSEGNVIADDGRRGTVRLPDINITANDPRNYRSAYHPEDVEQAFNLTGAGMLFNPFRLARTSNQFLTNPTLNNAVEIAHDALPWSKAGRFLLGAYGLGNNEGLAKTYDLAKEGKYGMAALSGLGDAFNTAMMIEGGSGVFNTIKGLERLHSSTDFPSAIEYAYNRNPELANIGTINDYERYIKTIFPESKVLSVQYHMGPKGLLELKPSTGDIWNTNPDARGIYVTPEKSYAEKIRKFTTDRLEKPSILTYLRRNITPGGWKIPNEQYTDIYPVMIDIRNPLQTKGTWTWGIKENKYNSLMDQYDGIINSGPRWWQNVNKMPETIVPTTEQTFILGSGLDATKFSNFIKRLSKLENVALSVREDAEYITNPILKRRFLEANENVNNGVATEVDRRFIESMKKVINTKRGAVPISEETKQEMLSYYGSERYRNRVIKNVQDEEATDAFINDALKTILNTPIERNPLHPRFILTSEGAHVEGITIPTRVTPKGTESVIVLNENAGQDVINHELNHAVDFTNNAAIESNKKFPLKEVRPSKFTLNGKPYMLDDIEPRTRAIALDKFLMKHPEYTIDDAYKSWYDPFNTKLSFNDLPLDARNFIVHYTENEGRTYFDNFFSTLPFGLGLAGYGLSNYSDGKDPGIHIKPENRGKFTRLKKRTGHSTAWFKAHGTPAQKKMATFAMNSKRWNHK